MLLVRPSFYPVGFLKDREVHLNSSAASYSVLFRADDGHTYHFFAAVVIDHVVFHHAVIRMLRLLEAYIENICIFIIIGPDTVRWRL
ncbi:MAG: hypothetical protein Q8O41_01650 [Candidatus Methanoperedens sp.]|nr:hypothetical protein [Candidatus Methanoperedens sp.]